jgi:hypothetical protein
MPPVAVLDQSFNEGLYSVVVYFGGAAFVGVARKKANRMTR